MRRIISILAVLGLAACANAYNPQFAPQPFSSELLTWDELGREAPKDAYSALLHLRPFFLTARPSSRLLYGQAPRIRVYIDGDFAGDADVLRTIPSRDVASIRRVQPAMAYATMGASHPGDEILMVQMRCRVAC